MHSDDSQGNLLLALINAAEKASNIARICRSNEELLKLLVQEKSEDESNPRFEHDFKTLADVLIQETIKHDVGKEFPAMREEIKGEESTNFTNSQGESISIAIGDSPAETSACLSQILHHNPDVAEVLASEVHREVVFQSVRLGNVPSMPADLDYTSLGVWIDPIDATAEYIRGDSIFTNFPGITSTGLDCVTVLIGVYNRLSGDPVIGVMSQPFAKKLEDNVYESRMLWGVSLPSLKATNCGPVDSSPRERRLGIFSSSERPTILQTIMESGYEFAFSAGAGHKALKVITGEVDLYLLSKGTTFKWDTCAPHAILRALNGEIIDFRQSVKEAKAIPLTYSEKSKIDGETNGDGKCNEGGLMAVRDASLLEPILQAFADKEI